MFRTKKDVDKQVRSMLSKIREDEVSNALKFVSQTVFLYPINPTPLPPVRLAIGAPFFLMHNYYYQL